MKDSWWIFNKTYFLAEFITLEKGPSDKWVAMEETQHMMKAVASCLVPTLEYKLRRYNFELVLTMGNG